ncbi:hypothetical protein [Lapidilactobacillus luobeiensis]|uniref:hypothetical protein n=1 Tax=Lapidilactobacillus luobeiensis TaxID=2950371 RepID=UPI0021C34856|nr:hypothetical protein [Lapidilactobacillus luobeiensis]
MTKKRRFLFMLLASFLLILTGCQKTYDSAAELKSDARTLQAEVKTQRQELKTIYANYAKIQRVFTKEQKHAPETNLLTDHTTQTYLLNQTAQKSYDKLKASQKSINQINERLKKVDISRINSLTSAELTELTQSIHIIDLDHQSFANFMSAFLKDQNNFYRDAPELYRTDKDGLDERRARANRYLGAVDQQLEILQVNLTSTEAAVKKILNTI